MFGTMRVLVLVVALGHTWAAVANDNCDQIKAKRLTPDDLDTISGEQLSFTERVMFTNDMCWKYNTHVNLTADSENTFSSFNSSMGVAGAVEFMNETCQTTYYKSCENCMSMEYKGIAGHVLFSSRREGHHQNVENLNEAQTKHDKLADCLGITAEKKYVYDEAADFCPKSSS